MAACWRGRETILVVDKIPVMRGAVAGMLRQLGYHVLEVGDTVEAKYQAHARRRIHLVVIDLPEPEMCHLELANWFRAIYPETKVLVTSSSFSSLPLQLDGSHRVTILTQPFTPFELARMVRLLLDDGGCAATGERADDGGPLAR